MKRSRGLHYAAVILLAGSVLCLLNTEFTHIYKLKLFHKTPSLALQKTENKSRGEANYQPSYAMNMSLEEANSTRDTEVYYYTQFPYCG